MGGGIQEIRGKIQAIGEAVHELSRLIESESLHTEDEKGLLAEGLEDAWTRIPEAVSPLAHLERVKILRSLRGGGKYFTELMNETGLSHSPLRFHLNVLVKGRYARQEYSRGRYLITRLGTEGLRHAVYLASLLEAEKEKDGEDKEDK